MPHESNPPRRSGKVVRLRRRHHIAGAFDYLRDSFPKHPAQVWEEALDRLRPSPSPWSGRVEIDVEPEIPPSAPPTFNLLPPDKALPPAVKKNRKAYEYLVAQLRRNKHYRHKTAKSDCRTKFNTSDRAFRVLWRYARVAAGLPARARPGQS